jgi:SsrA-binding protein
MIYARNKKALHEYEILKTFEAGIMLSGQEAKSIRSGGMKLLGAHVVFHKNTPQLLNAHIGKYAFAGNVSDYDPTRTRNLLLKQKEISYLRGKLEEKGLTITPLKVYTSGRRIKIEIALVKGKKLHDKRRSIKNRDAKRQKARILKGDFS